MSPVAVDPDWRSPHGLAGLHAALAETTPAVSVVADHLGAVTALSLAARQRGLREGQHWHRLVHPDDVDALLAAVRALRSADRNPGERDAGDGTPHGPGLTGVPARRRLRLLDADGAQHPGYAVLVDLDRPSAQAALAFHAMPVLATHADPADEGSDPLTGLTDRGLALDRLRQAVARLGRSASVLATLFVDLDGFGAVNDVHGHPVGDEALRRVARALTAAVRPADTVARWGGDEFLVVCEDVGGLLDGLIVADRLLRAVASLHLLDGAVGASIGLVIARHRGLDPHELVAAADAAMYRAKRAGGGVQASVLSVDTGVDTG